MHKTEMQEETTETTSRGFFDSPLLSEDWPACSLAPLCPTPPTTPTQGRLTHLARTTATPPESVCTVETELVSITCPSFLNIHILNTTYGRWVY